MYGSLLPGITPPMPLISMQIVLRESDVPRITKTIKPYLARKRFEKRSGGPQRPPPRVPPTSGPRQPWRKQAAADQ